MDAQNGRKSLSPHPTKRQQSKLIITLNHSAQYSFSKHLTVFKYLMSERQKHFTLF